MTSIIKEIDETKHCIQFLEERGYVIREPGRVKSNISFHRVANASDINDAFRWEACYMIANQLRPNYIDYRVIEKIPGISDSISYPRFSAFLRIL